MLSPPLGSAQIRPRWLPLWAVSVDDAPLAGWLDWESDVSSSNIKSSFQQTLSSPHHQLAILPSASQDSYIVTKTAQFTYPIDQRCMNTANSTALRKHSIVPGIRATPVPLPTRWKGGHIYQLPHSITPTPASPISCRYSILLFDALPYLVFKRKGLFLFKGSTAQDYLCSFVKSMRGHTLTPKPHTK